MRRFTCANALVRGESDRAIGRGVDVLDQIGIENKRRPFEARRSRVRGRHFTVGLGRNNQWCWRFFAAQSIPADYRRRVWVQDG